MCPFQTACTGGQLRDGQGGRVIDVKRAGFELLRSLNKAAEFILFHVTLTDFVGRNLGRFGQDTCRQLFRAHFERIEANDAALNSAFRAVGADAFLVGLGDIVSDVGRKRGFPHRRTTREDQKVRGVQTTQFGVQINQSGRNAGQLAFTLVGGVGNINCASYSLEKAYKTGIRLALFCQFVQRLFRLNDLVLRL